MTVVQRASWARGVCILALMSVMGLGVGCSGGDEAPPEDGQADGSADVEAPQTGGDAGTDAGQAQPEEVGLTAANLRPLISAIQTTGVAPEGFTVAFSRDVFADQIEDVGWRQDVSIPVPAETVLEISPSLAGKLTITSATTLTFKASEPLSPNTEYTVRLAKVKVGDETFEPPTASAWSKTFTTPRFGFVRMDLGAFDAKRGAADVRVIFSYPVKAAAVKPFMSFSLDGQALRPASFVAGSPANVVVVGIKSSKLTVQSATVGLELKAGAPMAADASLGAPSASAKVEIKRGEPMEILATRRMESDSGHYFDIICNDKAAPGGERWYWDDVYYDSYQISSRCELSEASAEESIHIDPAVAFYVAPSDAGFRIFGDFKRGTYQLRIDAGARTIDGGLLAKTYEKQLSVPARSPRVSFVSKGRYLPRDSWGNLAISHLNIDKVDVQISHIPQENLVFWMTDSSEAAQSRNSNIVARVEVPLKGAEDTETTSWIDVASIVPSPDKGVYEIKVNGRNKTDAARLLLTDMNLVVKADNTSRDQSYGDVYHAWALDIDTSQGLSGVKMKLVKASGQTVASCSTGADGGCKLQVPSGQVDPHGPVAIIASQGKDLTYLKFSDLKAPVSDDVVQGEPYGGSKVYRASIYSDRGVYRPGETAHVTAILRGKDNRAPAAKMPVSLELIDPRGNVARRRELSTNGAGMINADLSFEAFASTGRYEARLTVGKKAAGSYSFNVEEFVPERMKVEVASMEDAWLAGSEPRFAVDAKYLFGGTAAGSQVEVTCYLEPTRFKPKSNSDFDYGPWPGGTSQKRMTLGVTGAKLDVDGHAEVSCPGSSMSAVSPSRVVAEVAVFESGSGRTTRGSASAPVHPKPYYLGLKTSADKAKSGQAISVEGVVVDWRGKIVTDALSSVQMRYLRLEAEYSWYWHDEWNEETFERRLRSIPWGKDTVAVNAGRFAFKVTPTQRVDGLLIRVRSDGTQTDLQIDGDSRYWWAPSESAVNQTPRPMKPTALSLAVAGPARVGQPMEVGFDAPYKGRVLFTVETDRVLTTEWVDVTAGPVKWQYTPTAFAPNLYVSAFLVKDPHLDSAEAFRPDRAFGVTSVKVKPEAFTFEMKMNVPKEIRSNSELKVDLDLGAADGPTFVTVAAVDEGILSLTGFADPDPFKAIFAQRALGVHTYETVGWTLLVPPGGPSSSHGGGGGPELGRVRPVKPVALWSGVVEVPANGKVTVRFDVPQYRGSLRVMAVAAGKAKMGKASASVPVRDPLVLQTTLPRFLIDGDEIQIPVFVTNMSGDTQDVTIRLASESLAMAGIDAGLDPIPPLQLLGAREGKIRLANGENGTVVFQARARKKVGAARLRIEASAGALRSFEELDVPFAPNGPKSRTVQRIELSRGKTDVTQYLTGWVPTSEHSTIWVTANPYGESLDHLKYLVRYPYGCIEQTTSSTRPLLYVSSLLYNVDPGLVADGKVDKMIASGISRVMSMQTPEGGFAYWPGGTHPSWWGTAYATHMLVDAQRLGHEVSPTAMDSVMGWIEGQLSERPTQSGYYWGSFERAEPYLHYVLALAGKGRKAAIQQLIDALPAKATGQRAEEAYMLKAALYLTGDHRYEKELKAPDISALTRERKNSWSFYSDLRYRGFVLNIFQDLFKTDPAGEALADVVARGLARQRSRWYTTQELVWGVTGLGRWVVTGSGDFEPPTLTANGKERDARPTPKDQRVSDRTWSLARASEYDSLDLRLKGSDAEHVYLMLMSEGVREGASWEYGGQGLAIDRTYRNLEGEVIDPQNLKLGDMVYVEVSMQNNSKEDIQNVVMVDRLPAGWEIENPRLGRGGSVDWVDEGNLWESDYMNLRDDRVEVFGNIPRNRTVKVVYAARAVTAGSFIMPPIEAEAMYEPTIWARKPGQRVRISGPWADYLL